MKKVLTDIMGTAVHSGFVATLMNRFKSQGASYIARADPEALAIVDRIKAEQGLETGEQVISFVAEQLAQMNLRPNYVVLTGMVNSEGYENGELQAPFFEDVPHALTRWKKDGRGIFVYSQGSADEQKTIFRTSDKGDLTTLVDGYFGTDDVGTKYDPDSYRQISNRMQAAPSDITFLSDVVKELDAANKVGYNVFLVERPGNKPAGEHPYKVARSFDEVNL